MKDGPPKPFLRLIERGPLLRVSIHFHDLAVGSLSKIGLAPNHATTTLLVDTGACHTVVDQQILSDLGLEPAGTIHMFGTGGIVEDCPTYPVKLILHLDDGYLPLPTVIVGMSGHFNRGTEYRGLLGRSSLQGIVFRYDGPAGTFKIQKP